MKTSATLSLLFLSSHHHVVNSFAPINVMQGRTTATRALTVPDLSHRQAPPTQLSMADASTSENSNKRNGPFLNVGLVGQSLATQALVGSTIWTGGVGAQILDKNAHFGPAGIAMGLVGLLPLLYVSNKVETSESPYVAGLNLSTNMAVLRIFGSKPQPALALAVSLVLGGLTGVVEEVVFRGQVLPTLAAWSAKAVGAAMAPLAGAALSTIIFALLHTNPSGFFKGGDQTVDNVVLLAFQLVTGSIFAALYLGTGNLAVPIIAHALYDAWTFAKTHLDVSGQMEYAVKEALVPVGDNAVEQKWSEAKDDKFVQAARETFYLMDTNKDGMLSRKELRVALFSYGISLSKLESAKVASVADLDKNGSIDFDEFLEFIGPAGSTNKAVRNALLGPV